MKFILFVILGLCAFAVQANELDSLSEIENNELLKLTINNRGLQDIINSVIQFAQNAVNGIVDRIEKIANQVRDSVQKLVEQATEQLEKIRDQIEKTLEEIAKQSEVARQCVEEQRPRIQNVLDSVTNGLNNCALNASKEVEKLQQQVGIHVDAIGKQINELKELVAKCLRENRPIGVIGCISKQASEIRGKINTALSSARQAIELAAERVPEITESVRKCSLDVVSNAAKELQQIVADIRKCISEKN